MISFRQFLSVLTEFGVLSAVGKFSPAIIKQQAVGILAILFLNKSGINTGIANVQNDFIDRFQEFQDTFKVDKGLRGMTGFVGKKCGFSDADVDGFKDFVSKMTRPDSYKASKVDIQILEMALLQAGIFGYNTKNPAVGASAFVFFGISLWVAKKQMELKGKDFELANLLGNIPVLGSLMKPILSLLNDTDAGNEGIAEDPFKKPETFTNDGYDTDDTDDLTDSDSDIANKQYDEFNKLIKNPDDLPENYKSIDKSKKIKTALDDEDVKDDLKNLYNDNLNMNDDEFHNNYGLFDDIVNGKFEPLIDNSKNEPFLQPDPFAPIIDNSKDGFKPIFDNSENGSFWEP